MSGLLQDRVSRLHNTESAAGNTRTTGNTTTNTNIPPPPHAESSSIVSRISLTPEVLARTVEREVIPRLMDAHQPQRISMLHAEHIHLPDRADVVEFTGLIAARDIAAALSSIDLKRGLGMSLEEIYLHLLVPTARRLSELWEADQCHYEDIAVGMLHLQQVLNELSPDFSNHGEVRAHGRKALLLSAPGERNMLGVFMVTEFYRSVASEFFHRGGWEVWRSPPTSRSQLLAMLNSQWFDIIDVSASCEGRLDVLSTDLAEMRKASRNSGVSMLVGGPAFDMHPEFVTRVGADAAASDPRHSLEQAELLIELREQGRGRP